MDCDGDGGTTAHWMTVDADVAFTNARFADADPVGTRIPGALDRVISAGVTIEPRRPLFGSLRVRHFGPRPLVEDASVNSKSTTICNGEVGYRLSSRARGLNRGSGPGGRAAPRAA